MAEPLRTCIGCRQTMPKAQLVRLVARGGQVEVDGQGAAPGRGAYVCSAACAAKAAAGKAFGRAFRAAAAAGEGLAGQVVARLETLAAPAKGRIG